MKRALEVVFRGMERDPEIVAFIHERAQWLEGHGEEVLRCRTVVDEPHQHSQNTARKVSIEFTLPGDLLVAHHEDDHEDPRHTIRVAFNQARRQLQHRIERERDKDRRAGREDASPPEI